MHSFKYYSIFQHIFVFLRETFFDTMISSKKVVMKPRAGRNEAKICPKTAENCKYSYLQCNNSNTIESFNIFLSLLGKQI